MNASAPFDITKLSPAHFLPPNMGDVIQAEQDILGQLLCDNSRVRFCERLRGEHFYEDLHNWIYTQITGIIGQGDIANITSTVAACGDFDVGGRTMRQYLASLQANASQKLDTLQTHVALVIDMATKRELAKVGVSFLKQLAVPGFENTALANIETIETALQRMRPDLREQGGLLPFSRAVSAAVDRAFQARAGTLKDGALSTGFPRLDEALGGGLFAPDFVVIGGRPGSGKTALATNIADAVARVFALEEIPEGQRRRVVAFFSLEMSAEQLASRVISDEVKIPTWRIRQGKFDADEADRLQEAVARHKESQLRVDQQGALPLAVLANRARQMHRISPLGLIVVDYLQLMSGSGNGSETNRVQELTRITTGLKALAKELNVPIIALAQLNRGVESRDDKRPMMSDLKDSGSIEQDADVVMFVYREEYYLKQRRPPEGSPERDQWERDMERAAGRAEIILSKSRHADTTVLDMGFDGPYTAFRNEAPPVVEIPEPEPPKQAIKLADGPTLFLKALMEAVDDYGETAPAHWKMIGKPRVVDIKHVRTVYREHGKIYDQQRPHETLEEYNARIDAKLNVYWSRHLDKLRAQGIIATRKDFVWHAGPAVKGVPATWIEEPKAAPAKPKAPAPEPWPDDPVREDPTGEDDLLR